MKEAKTKLIVTMSFPTTEKVSTLLYLLERSRNSYDGQRDEALRALYEAFKSAAVTYSVTVRAEQLPCARTYTSPSQAEVSVFLKDPSHLFLLKSILEEGVRDQMSHPHQDDLLSMIPIIESASVSRLDAERTEINDEWR